MGKLPSPTQRQIYRDEIRNQSVLYHNEKDDRKAARAAERAERTRLAKLEFEQRKARDFAWGAAREMDTDEQILDYIRSLAAELGHTPAAKGDHGVPEKPQAAYVAKIGNDPVSYKKVNIAQWRCAAKTVSVRRKA